jgi:hypothetical protein
VSDTIAQVPALSVPLLTAEVADDQATVRWSAVPGATGYEVQVGSGTGVQAAWNAGARETALAFPASLLPVAPAPPYVVRMRARTGDDAGPWSAPRGFVPAPALAGPPADEAAARLDDGAPAAMELDGVPAAVELDGVPAAVGLDAVELDATPSLDLAATADLGGAGAAGVLLPAPLLQVTCTGGSIVLDYTTVTGASGYTGQVLSGGTVVATQSATGLSMSFAGAQYNLTPGTTYVVRVAATADGATGKWSALQSVTFQELAAPAALVTFEGGTLLGNVQTAVEGAAFYSFEAFTMEGGENTLVAQAFAAASALPAAFDGSFTDGQAYTVAAQAVDGNVLSAWSDPVPITVQVLTPPTLTLTYASPALNASWQAVDSLTQYQFQLWTVAQTPQRIDDQTLTAAPYQVQVSTGLVEDQLYQGRVRSQSGLNSSTWATAQARASILDPLLVALYDSLNTSWGGGATLTLDAATLTTPGAAIVALMSDNLGVSEIVLDTGIALASDAVADTVTASGSAQGTLLGIDAPAVTAVFRVAGGALVADIQVEAGIGYTLDMTFPSLQDTLVGGLAWDDSTAGSPSFVLSSLGAPAAAPYGALLPGLNFYGDLLLEGNAAPLLTLIPGTPDPLPVTGLVAGGAAGGTFSFQLAASVGDVSFSSLPSLGTLAFASPRFIVNASSNGVRTSNALWVSAPVSVGGVTLPLAVQLPIGAQGWLITLLPGSTVPVPDLGTFFGFVTGTSVSGALPAQVAGQTGLQLQTFRISINPAFNGFGALTMSINSGTASVSAPLWSPLPGVLELTTLNLNVVVASSGGSLAVRGSIGGSVLLGGTLQVGANIQLPVGTGSWTFFATTATSLTSLAAFNTLVGGGDTTFAGTLPAGLGNLPQFTLGSLTLVVNPVGPTLTSLSLQLYSNSPWSIVGSQVVLKELAVSLSMTNPTQSSRVVTGSIGASLVLGSVLVDALVANPGGGPWTLTVSSDAVPLPSLGDLADFVGGAGAAALLPSTLATASFALSDVSVVVDLSNQTLQSIGFTLWTADTWVIIGPAALTAGGVSAWLALDWTSGSQVTTGTIQGTIGVAEASFILAATYADSAWILAADMAPPTGTEGVLDFGAALTQLGIGGQFVIPSGVGLPSLQLTGGSLLYVQSTGELTVSATSALSWPIAFGTGTTPMQVATLGASVHRLANGAGWTASLNGSLVYGGIQATVALQLGSAGTDTVLTAAVGTVTPANVATLADDLAKNAEGTNAWSTLPVPADFPSIGLAQAQLYFNLTKNVFVLTGSSSVFGTAAFVVQQSSGAWQAALGVNLSSGGQPWTFSEISAGLAAAGSFFNIDQASAALALSTIDGQSLGALATQVPELANALPATVSRGGNFYGVLHFSGPVVSNVPRILGTDAGTTVTLYALVAQASADSYFQVDLDQYTLAGVVTFSAVRLTYQPATSPSLSLDGRVSIPLGSSSFDFDGSMRVAADSARFSIQQTPQSVVEPFGMKGITLSGLGVLVTYAFPDAVSSTLTIQMSGTTQLGTVANLTGLIYLVNGTPSVAAIAVTDFDITNLFTQSIGVDWPSLLVPLVLTSGVVYYSNASTALTLDGTTYQPGFNASAQVEIFGVPATLGFAVVPGSGVTASGRLNNPIDWGFVVITSALSTQAGPGASLATYPTTTFTLAAGFTLFGYHAANVTFSIAKDATLNENVATLLLSANVGAPFGTISITLTWSESQGIRFQDFPLDFPANFEIPNITFPSGACSGKAILKALPIDTTYDLDSSFTITGGSLVITFQGSFKLTALNQQVLTIQLQTLTATIPPPSGGDAPFQWSDIPGWIARTIIDNAGSMIQQVLNDPASMGKLLAIEGVKFVAAEVIDALVCDGWSEAAAESLIEAATSSFVTEVVIDGVTVIAGGVGLVIGAGGVISVGGGGGDNPPPKPGAPGNLSMNYTGDVLSLGWGAPSNAQAYSWRLQDSGGGTVASQSNIGGRSASVGVGSLTWGATYTLTVLASNQGVMGPASTLSYTLPTPQGVASAQHSGGTPLAQAGTAVRQVFPSVDAVTLGNALIGAYGAGNPATYATPVATALFNAGYGQATADAALPQLSWSPAITPAQVASAIQAAYTLNASQYAQYLAQHGMSPAATAQMLAGAFTLNAAQVASLLQANYSGIDAATLVGALAGAGYAMPDTAAAVQAALGTAAADMAGYLVTAFAAQSPTPASVALVLMGVYGAAALPPAVLVQALQGAFTDPALTAAQAAQALVAAVTQPEPVTAAVVAATLNTAFPTAGATGIAGALVAAFTTPSPITPAQVAQALAALPTPPSLNDVAMALATAFAGAAITPAQAAQALVAAFPTTSAVPLGQALVAAFTTPAPLTAAQAGAAIVAALPATAVNDLATDLTQIFAGISQNDVATALLAAFPPLTLLQAGGALVAAFAAAATPATVALAMTTAFPAATATEVAQALVAVFTASPPTPTPTAVALALVAAFAQPTPLDAGGVLTALLAAFPALTATQAAQALVAAFPAPAPITPAQVVAQLLAATFTPALTPADVAQGLAAAWTGEGALDAAAVLAAMITGYGAALPAASQLAVALLAAFPQTSADQLAQALQAAPFATPLTVGETAVAVAAAFPSISPAELAAALFAAFTGGAAPTAPVLAAALVAALPAATATALALAQVLVARYTTPTPITAAEVAAALAGAMTNPPVPLADLVGALQGAFTAPVLTLAQAAQALQQAYAGTTPLTAGALAAALLAGWTPAPALNDVAVALAAALAELSPSDLAVALLAAFPESTANQLAGALVAAVPQVTAAQIGTALLAAMPVLTQGDVAQAIVSALPQTDAATAGQALVQAFGTPAATYVTVAAALAAAAYTLPQVAPALNTVFTVAPGENARALAGAFPAASGAEVLQALVDVYTAATVPPATGAVALVGAFTQPPPIIAAQVAAALVAVYTTPAPITPAEVTAALRAAYPSLGQGEAAGALVAAFTQPAPITAPEVAQALTAAYGTAATPETVAAALVAAFAGLAAADAVAALQSAFATLTATQAAQALVAAFTQPAPITAPAVAVALVARFAPLAQADCASALLAAFGVTLQPADAAVALVAAYTDPAITQVQVVAALQTAYGTLSASAAAVALVAAFTQTSPGQVASTLVASFNGIGAPDVAAALVAAFPGTATPEVVSTALQSAFPQLSLGDAAVALAGAFATPVPLTPTQVAAALVQTFPAATATMAAVATAVLAAFPQLGPGGMAAALFGAFAGANATQVAAALVAALGASASVVAAALVAAQPSISPAEVMAALVGGVTTDLPTVAAALAGAFPALTQPQLAPVLVAGAPSATVNQVAAALRAAFASTTTVATLLTALVAGYASSTVVFNPAVASVALRFALELGDADAGALASALAGTFQLTRVPNDVGALGVCLQQAGIGVTYAASAMAQLYGSAWNGTAYATLLSVYAAPEWQLAIPGSLAGTATAQVAAEIIEQIPALPAQQMALVMGSSYFLTYVTTPNAVLQVSQAMFAAAYPLTQASSAMAIFYGSAWGGPQYQILLQVYNQT